MFPALFLCCWALTDPGWSSPSSLMCMLAPPVRIPTTRTPHSCRAKPWRATKAPRSTCPTLTDLHTSSSPTQFGLTVRQREAAGEEWARDRGTPRYMAPEFWDDELADAIGEAADVRRGGCPGKRGVGGPRVDLADAIGEGGEDAWRLEGSPWVGSRPCGKVCPCEWATLPSCLVGNEPMTPCASGLRFGLCHVGDGERGRRLHGRPQ